MSHTNLDALGQSPINFTVYYQQGPTRAQREHAGHHSDRCGERVDTRRYHDKTVDVCICNCITHRRGLRRPRSHKVTRRKSRSRRSVWARIWPSWVEVKKVPPDGARRASPSMGEVQALRPLAGNLPLGGDA